MSKSKKGYINAHSVPPLDTFQKQEQLRRERQGLDVERLARALQETILTTPDQFMGPGMGAYRKAWSDLTLQERRQVLSDAKALARAYAEQEA